MLARREAQGPLHDRPDSRGAPGPPPRTAFEDDQGEQWLLIHKRDETAVDGLGRRGPPAERQVRPHQRRGQGERAGDLAEPDARRRGRDRPVGGRREADARLPRADGRDARHPRRSRDDDWLFEVKWDGYRVEAVIRDGADPAVHAPRQRRRDVLPAAPHAAHVDRGARRRSSTARWSRSTSEGRPDFSLLQERITSYRGGRGGRARVPGVRPAVPRRPVAARRAAGGAQEAAEARPARDVAGEVRRPHRARGRRVLRGGRAQRLEGIVAKHRRSRYEPGPARAVVAEAQGAAGAGAGGRRLDARREQREGAGRARRGRLRGRQAAVLGQGGLGLRPAGPAGAAQAARRADDGEAGVRPAARRPTSAAAGAATSTASSGRARSSSSAPR